MWIDASLPIAGYGHNVGGYGARLGRLAADLWEHFGAGTRPTVLDLAAWHASARVDRIVVAHPDGTTQVPVGRGAEAVAAVRAAATRDAGEGVSPLPRAAKMFVATVDQDRLGVLLDGEVADGSTALLSQGGPGHRGRWCPPRTWPPGSCRCSRRTGVDARPVPLLGWLPSPECRSRPVRCGCSCRWPRCCSWASHC
ncbi:hypothetical protein U2F26_12485 [Micromonospora sp. 4G57]|uniref:Uncharacterized protein n=1 Tax=Micromonospora sicca TaxID=2202420 RepID=A0ABU5J8S7_9ACTN|nr:MULTISPECIES: hypothetical protein [unclassified Micromonospora]MDZ5443547.1 hypothetical protein [Micromonospora sp. 4G57]MDZ5488980.1 hypothetical protein [Micromonospora sp. 4G53]